MRFPGLIMCALLTGCTGRGGPRASELVIEWENGSKGRFAASARAVHCAETGVVELEAVRGDTGVAAALFLTDSSQAQAADYPVFLASSFPEPRPGALAAVRWFDHVSVVAWEGLRGTIALEPGDSVVSGTFTVTMQKVDNPDTLLLTGRFQSIPLVRADSGCLGVMRRYTI